MDVMWLMIIFAFIFALILFLKSKSDMDKLNDSIRYNKEMVDKETVLLDTKITSLDTRLNHTLDITQELSKSIEINNKEIASLESKTTNTNEAVLSNTARLDDTVVTIQNITQRISDNENQLNKKYNELLKLLEENKDNIDYKISELARSIIELRAINKDLKHQLSIFTEIDADSKQLNADNQDYEEENPILNVDPKSNTDITLDTEKSHAFDLMNNSLSNLFITGKAGTGKSFLLKHFVKETTKKVLVLAPTGIAALNVNGTTIHTAFGWENLRLNIDEINNDRLKLNNKKSLVLKNVDTIIIDEISMVRADIFEKIDRILRLVNNKNIPFGGKQILLFGDIFQLPPIADKEEIKYLKDTFGSKYFFSSYAYQNGGFTFNELTINHRQKDDSVFFDILNNIREGNVSNESLKLLNQRTKFEYEDLRRVVRLYPRKNEVEYINQRELDNIPAKEYSYECKVTYTSNNLNLDIEKNLPISETLRLKLGALVMLVTNDENHRWVNGTLGIVSFINENCIKVMISGHEYEIHPTTFCQQESFYENGKIIYKTIYEVEQYPIILAYAITIHKSQGMTYKKVACDVSKCFEVGQVYVALSRCTDLNGLWSGIIKVQSTDSLKCDRIKSQGESR